RRRRLPPLPRRAHAARGGPRRRGRRRAAARGAPVLAGAPVQRDEPEVRAVLPDVPAAVPADAWRAPADGAGAGGGVRAAVPRVVLRPRRARRPCRRLAAPPPRTRVDGPRLGQRARRIRRAPGSAEPPVTLRGLTPQCQSG